MGVAGDSAEYTVVNSAVNVAAYAVAVAFVAASADIAGIVDSRAEA